MLVEDNDADAGLVREALEEHGIDGELIVATDGEKAMEVIRDIESKATASPDLFIVDLNLPKRPGYMVLASLRDSVKCRHAPVAVLTSSDIPNDQEAAMRSGFSQYLRKPSRLEDFLALGAIFKSMLKRPSD